jgi:flagellar basal body-associated protein FliL
MRSAGSRQTTVYRTAPSREGEEDHSSGRGLDVDTELEELSDRAVELTEDALSQVTRLAIELIRRGKESSPHVEAAERELRNALRQLVAAKRERTPRVG